MYERHNELTVVTRDTIIPGFALTRETIFSVYTPATVLTWACDAIVYVCRRKRKQQMI